MIVGSERLDKRKRERERTLVNSWMSTGKRAQVISCSDSVDSTKNSVQKRNCCFSFSTGLSVAAQRLMSLMFSIVDFRNLKQIRYRRLPASAFLWNCCYSRTRVIAAFGWLPSPILCILNEPGYMQDPDYCSFCLDAEKLQRCGFYCTSTPNNFRSQEET